MDTRSMVSSVVRGSNSKAPAHHDDRGADCVHLGRLPGAENVVDRQPVQAQQGLPCRPVPAASRGRNHQALISGSPASSVAIRSAGRSVATVLSPRQSTERSGRSVPLTWAGEVMVTCS